LHRKSPDALANCSMPPTRTRHPHLDAIATAPQRAGRVAPHDEGNFGRCLHCEEDISPKRLERCRGLLSASDARKWPIATRPATRSENFDECWSARLISGCLNEYRMTKVILRFLFSRRRKKALASQKVQTPSASIFWGALRPPPTAFRISDARSRCIRPDRQTAARLLPHRHNSRTPTPGPIGGMDIGGRTPKFNLHLLPSPSRQCESSVPRHPA